METHNLSSLVVQLEQTLTDSQRQLGEVFATLLVNFGPENRSNIVPLCERDDKPIGALIKVCEHYMKWKERCLAAEKFINAAEPKTFDVGAAGMVAYHEWKNIVDNCNLRKEFLPLNG
jgi:hypothetical protein